MNILFSYLMRIYQKYIEEPKEMKRKYQNEFFFFNYILTTLPIRNFK